MKIKSKSRFLAWVLAGAMTVTSVPMSGLQTVQAAETPILAAFDFNAAAQNGVITGQNASASVQGSAEITALTDTDSALYLNGTDAFVNITAPDGGSLLTDKEAITVSYDAKPEKGSKSWTFFAAPNANKQSYPNEHYLGVLHTSGSITVQRFNNTGTRPGNDITQTVTNAWTHVDVVYDETETTLYINGTQINTKASDYALSDVLGSSSVIQLGKANWDDGEFYKGYIDNFKIFDGVLSDEELAAEYSSFQSAQEAISAADAEKNKPIILDYNALTLPNVDDVRNDLGLIKKGANGSTIEWTSSNPDVITDYSVSENDIYDGGIVTRPAAGEEPVKVTLTATLSYEGEEDKVKQFEVTVQPMPADLDTDYSAGYLWINFGTEGGYEKIFFGYSEDGLTWSKLNKLDGVAQPILTNDAKDSDLGVRDPHLIRSVDGDKYWIIGTDLHAEGGGSGGSGWNQLSASQNLVVWESNDLVNWSEPRLVYAGFDKAGCVWAPEAIYDDTTGDYVVYWSARDYSKNGTDENALRVYVCRTRDFNTFTTPKVWLSEDQDSGSEVNIIDTTIVKDNDKYYRFSTSDWYTVIDVSDTLDTEDVLDVRVNATQSQPNSSWTRIVTRDGSTAAGFDSREGMTVYQLPDGKWCAMGDHSGYKAFVTDDLSSGTFTEAASTFTDGKFRHGTVVRLSATEEAAILEAFAERTSPPDPGRDEETAENPVLEYTFEEDADDTTMSDTSTGSTVAYDGTLYGNAKVEFDEERNSNVLVLDGTSGTYAEIPQGFFDKRNTMTISMDVKSQMSSGNFFTFTYGKNNTVYDFLRIRGSEVRNAVTVNSYTDEKEVKASGASVGEWQNVVIVIDNATMKLYLDGSLVATNSSVGFTTTALGTDLLAYLGKSMYSGDSYFKGSFDNFKVYNRALSDDEILTNVLESGVNLSLLKKAVIGTIPADPDNTQGTDDHTAVTSKIDKTNKVITSYVRKTADLKSVPLTLSLLVADSDVTLNGVKFVNGSNVNLTKDATIVIKLNDKTETYTIKTPEIAYNPVLPGQYADPDIDYFDGKYWIYPTTDGASGWGGTVFHAWSSTDLVNWTDEGVILDVAKDDPGINDKGVAIADSPWSDGNAWAPSIEEKNGKYYFYYCGNIKSSYTGTCGSGKAIGVAVSDNPAGPFVAEEYPIVDPATAASANGGFSGQVIDPSVFTDDDGTSYLFFGNGGGGCTVARLNDDMVTIDETSLVHITGMTDFRESVVVTKRNGIYHFTWSCDDTGSPNYHVNYGVLNADSLSDAIAAKNVNVSYKYTLLQKDESGDMLGTAHQSVVYIPQTDKCYIAYHRFYTPLGVYTSGLGYHRETCIDEITFDPGTGYMNKVSPTMQGMYVPKTIVTPTPTPKPQVKPVSVGTTTTNANGSYVVTKVTGNTGEVTFKAVSNKKAKSISVPTSVTVGSTVCKVTKIEDNAFKGCTKLTNITIPSTVVTIGKSAFSGCNSLKSITIPANVKTIDSKAFNGCKNLKKITIKSTVLKKVGKSAFKGINKKATIKVPKKQKKAYQKLLKKKGQASTVKIK